MLFFSTNILFTLNDVANDGLNERTRKSDNKHAHIVDNNGLNQFTLVRFERFRLSLTDVCMYILACVCAMCWAFISFASIHLSFEIIVSCQYPQCQAHVVWLVIGASCANFVAFTEINRYSTNRNEHIPASKRQSINQRSRLGLWRLRQIDLRSVEISRLYIYKHCRDRAVCRYCGVVFFFKRICVGVCFRVGVVFRVFNSYANSVHTHKTTTRVSVQKCT